MKKASCVLLAALLLFSLAACGSAQSDSGSHGGSKSTAKTVGDVLDELTAPSAATTAEPPEVTPETGVSEPAPTPATAPAPAAVDVDLTALSSTMVYSEVYNMMMMPGDYVGKVIKMSGLFYPYTNQDDTQQYPACLIEDASACCAQGIEFLLAGAEYPSGYPEIGSTITVTGTFETYEEDGLLYCRLVDAWL